MHAIENVLNLFARRIGFDLYVERWCAWSDFANWQLGHKRLAGSGRELLLWAGPIHFAISRTARRA